MKVQLISHACVVISTSDTKILCDPWFDGTAFNNSWKLFPKPTWTDKDYDEITHLWISHEHPDHFHFPTLKNMPASFKERVTLLFQRNNTDKMPKAFKKLGFKNIVLLPNRKQVKLTKNTRVVNYQIGQMDSALAVKEGIQCVLNLNDCETTTTDCKMLAKSLGKIDVLLNQFSMAGYGGAIDYKTELKERGRVTLENMVSTHRHIMAGVTIPMASFVYFCCEDNKFMNDYANTPKDVYEKFKTEDLGVEVLYLNDEYDLDTKHSHTISALKKYDAAYQDAQFEIDALEKIPLEKIEAAFFERTDQLTAHYPALLLRKLKEVKIRIPDLNKTVAINVSKRVFRESDARSDYNLIINSQPLHHAFKFTWGVQTLGVSARWFIQGDESTWNWYRAVTSMNNGEFYLKPKFLFKKSNFNFLQERLKGSGSQLMHKIKSM